MRILFATYFIISHTSAIINITAKDQHHTVRWLVVLVNKVMDLRDAALEVCAGECVALNNIHHLKFKIPRF